MVGAKRIWLERILSLIVVVELAILVWLLWDQEAIMAWFGRAGPLPFFAAMAFLPALGAPITPFFVVAGATFGVTVGIAGSMLALLLNLVVCYWLARTRLRGQVEKLLRRFDFEVPNFESRKSALRFTLLVKVAPGIPGFVKHYGLGAAGVPFGIYLAVAMLVTGGYGLLLIVLGGSLMDHDLDRLLVVAGVAALLVLGVWWWHRRQEQHATAGSTSANASPSAT